MSNSIRTLTLVAVLGLWNLPDLSIASTGGITQTTFFSTDKGSYSGATATSFTGPDGVTHGECTYTDGKGRSITIKYQETPGGVVTASSESEGVADPDTELTRCQSKVEKLQSNLTQAVQDQQRKFNASMQEFEGNLKTQMDKFKQQQETFAEQHRKFLEEMGEFSKRAEENARKLEESLTRQTAGLADFDFGFF